MKELRRFIAIIICLTTAGVAMWRNMEILAIVSLLATINLLYIGYAKHFYYSLLDAFHKAKQAKFGDLEVVLQDGTVFSVKDMDCLPPWGRVVLSQLSSRDIGVLIQLSHTEGKEVLVSGLREAYLNLRARGLLKHDAPSLYKSKYVWLSKTGYELSALLLVKVED